MSPRPVAADEQAVESAVLADEVGESSAYLAMYDRVENSLHRKLLTVCDDPAEKAIVAQLICGDERVERPRITRVRTLAAALSSSARRLAGAWTNGIAR